MSNPANAEHLRRSIAEAEGRDAEVSRRLNELFADPAQAEEQATSASALDAAGTAWNEERW